MVSMTDNIPLATVRHRYGVYALALALPALLLASAIMLAALPPSLRGGGLCVAATLWAVVSYLGFVGAPMLWSAVGIANLEKARQLQRLEREQNVIYYQAPRTTPRGKRRSCLFAVPAAAQ